MKTISNLKKSITTFVVVAFTLLSIQAPVMAGVVTAEQMMAEQRIDQQRESVQTFFSRDDVKAQLMARGVDVGAAQSRVASMSATELASMQQQIDSMPAGEGVLGLVIALLVIFMLLDIAGVTDIFPAI